MSCPKKRALACAECPDKGKAFSSSQELNEHYRFSHQGLKVYKCGEEGCKFQFLQKRSLIRHLDVNHQFGSCYGEAAVCSSGEAASGLSTGSVHHLLFPSDEIGENIEVADHSSSDVYEVEETGDKQNVDDRIDLTMIAAQVLLKLRSTSSLTGKAIERFQAGCRTLLNEYHSHVVHQVSTLLKENGMADADVFALVSKIDEPGDPFKNLKTIQDQLDFFCNTFGLVKPQAKFLDTRIDKRLDSQSNSYVQTQVIETFQYCSVIDTLIGVLSCKKNRDNIFKDYASKDGVLRSYMDGSHFKEHPFLTKHDNIIQIVMFYDDLEVTNAQGSKTIIHKMGVFFFQIMNFPAHLSSQLSSIHLLALAHSDDLKKQGAFEKVLLPFVQEMKKLSSDDGVQIVIDGSPFVLRAALVTVTADTLAAHELLGFIGPSAKHFCRMCMISRTDFREHENSIGELRTPQDHDLQVQEVAAQPRSSSKYGVKGRKCGLNDIPYYHCIGGSVFDAFHDLLEGVCPLVIQCVLRNIIYIRKLITVADFNSQVASFDYGIPDRKNKPSANFNKEMFTDRTKKIKQTGSQVWCLMRVLPFLVGHLLPIGDAHMELVFLLQEIMKIVFSFEIRPADVDYLETLILRHNSLFKSLFVNRNERDTEDGEQEQEEEDVDDPDDVDGDENEAVPGAPKKKKDFRVHMINKLHHLLHYPDLIKLFGPLIRLWCAKFEARMKVFRQHSAIVNCFKNITKTMAEMFQLSNCRTSGDDEVSIEFQKGVKIPVTEELLVELGRETDNVFKTNAVNINGEEYRRGLFVCVSTPGSLKFYLINDIFIVEEREVYLHVKQWRVETIEPRYNAHKVSPDDNFPFVFLNTKSLTHCHAISPWYVHNDTGVYLSVRTLVL